MSGSIGGMTGSHNAGGLYLRARAIPVNPNTAFQIAVRAALTQMVTRWTSVLTAAQRAAWNLYGTNTPVVDTLGDSRTLSGQQWYNASQIPRGQAITKLSSTLTVIDDAPTVFNRGDFTTPTAATSGISGLQITFTNSDDWANEDDAAMLIFQGKPRNASRSFFKGPFRLVGVIEGDSGTPPTSPVTLAPATLATLGYVTTAGQRCMVAVAVTRADGRISTRANIDTLTIT